MAPTTLGVNFFKQVDMLLKSITQYLTMALDEA